MIVKRVVFGIGTLLASLTCMAGASSGPLNVNIAMTRNSGVCLNETLSAGLNASVWVVCQTGHFVDITPVPGRPFAASHGGAYRFNFGAGYALGPGGDGLDSFAGTGTVTALRVYDADRSGGPLELLVSF